MIRFWLGCALWIGLSCGIAIAGSFFSKPKHFDLSVAPTAVNFFSDGSNERPTAYLKSCEVGKGIWTSKNTKTNSFQQFEIFGYSATNGISQISKVTNDKVVWVSRGAYRCLGSPLSCTVEFSDRAEVKHSAKTVLSKNDNSVQFRNFKWDREKLAAGSGLDAFWQAGHTPDTDGDAIPDNDFVLTECKK